MPHPDPADRPRRLLPRTAPRIRVAVAGLGKMGGYHLRALQRLAGGESEEYYKAGIAGQIGKVEICGLCDPAAPRGRETTGIAFFSDWAALLAEAKPDLVVIASPTKTHFRLATQALEAGAHTFVEKPLVTRLDEYRALAELARAQGCRLMSGHVERYNPVAVKIRDLLAAGGLRPREYEFHRSQPHDPRIPDDIVTDKIIHDLDLSLYLFGPIADWRLADAKRREGRVQEATVRLRNERGAEGVLFVSWLLPEAQRRREVRIRCEGGAELLGDFAGKRLSLDGREIPCAVPAWIKPDNNQIKDELVDFLSYCLEPEGEIREFEPLLRPADIEASVRILEALGAEVQARESELSGGGERCSGSA